MPSPAPPPDRSLQPRRDITVSSAVVWLRDGLRQHQWFLWLALGAITTGQVWACKVPVFRYALERWPVDRYRAVAIIDGEPVGELQQAVADLRSLAGTTANLDIDVIDLATLSDQELWQLEAFDGSAAPPLLQIFYPAKDGQRRLCWQGELSPAEVARWSHSTLRERLADDLTAGVSALFLLREGANAEQNDQLAADLENWLSLAAAQIEIPAGVIPRDRAGDYLQDHPAATMDDVLRSDIPLRVDFQLRRLSRDNDSETALRAMIGGLDPAPDQPVVVPIFGRGRMLDAIPAEQCNAATILAACRYLVGECSCTVKALNPGVDLLLTVDWSARLGSAVVLVQPPTDLPPALVPIPAGQSVADSPPAESPQVAQRGEPTGNVWIWGGLGFALLGGAALVFRLRRTS